MSNGELFATPQETVRRARALEVRFTALWKQAGGKKRRKDVAPKLLKEIASNRKRFGRFMNRPLFGLWGALLPRGLVNDDYSVLMRWYKTYARLAAKLAKVIPEPLWKGAAPKKLPKQSLKQLVDPLVDPLRSAAYTFVAVAAVGWLVSQSSRPRDYYRGNR